MNLFKKSTGNPATKESIAMLNARVYDLEKTLKPKKDILMNVLSVLMIIMVIVYLWKTFKS